MICMCMQNACRIHFCVLHTYPHVFSGQVEVEEVEDPLKLRLSHTFSEPFTLKKEKKK